MLGVSEDVVGNVEWGLSIPTYAFVLGCALLFGKSSDRLFPYLYNTVQEDVGRAALTLDEKLRGRTDSLSRKKLALLSAFAKRTLSTDI